MDNVQKLNTCNNIPSSQTFKSHPLTDMSIRNLPGVTGGRRVRLTTSPSSVSRLSRENVGASTSHKTMVLYGLLQEYLMYKFITFSVHFHNIYKNELRTCTSTNFLRH
jgi:hypothetical protein